MNGRRRICRVLRFATLESSFSFFSPCFNFLLFLPSYEAKSLVEVVVYTNWYFEVGNRMKCRELSPGRWSSRAHPAQSRTSVGDLGPHDRVYPELSRGFDPRGHTASQETMLGISIHAGFAFRTFSGSVEQEISVERSGLLLALLPCLLMPHP